MKLKNPYLNPEDGALYHIRVKPGEVGKYVILPGDPFRTDVIKDYFDQPRLVAHAREHKTWTGYLDGEMVSVCSTGMGCPSASIAVEELIACGADTFIRVGTAGRLADSVQDEAINGAIITGSVRDEGLTSHYVPKEYPAMANRFVVEALAQAAKKKNLYYVEGIAHCKDSYFGMVDPDSLPNGAALKTRIQMWKDANVITTEMETAALFVVSQIRGCRAGAVMSFTGGKGGHHTAESIELAVEAIRDLIKQDKAAKK